LTRCSHLQELLSADLEPNLTLWLGLWLVGVGLLWKLAAAPLHMWAADVYQGAWTSVTLLISLYLKSLYWPSGRTAGIPYGLLPLEKQWRSSVH